MCKKHSPTAIRDLSSMSVFVCGVWTGESGRESPNRVLARACGVDAQLRMYVMMRSVKKRFIASRNLVLTKLAAQLRQPDSSSHCHDEHQRC